MKKERGITLIALVITIIVLIILAGVSINLVLGENGIITRAKYAKEQYEMAQVKEKIEMAIVEMESEEITSGREISIDILIGKLPIKLQGITVSKEENILKGTYDDYNFVIDENFKVTIEGYNSSQESDDNIPEVYTVAFTGTNVTSNGTSTINENETYTANLTLANKYGVSNVVVRMSGTELTENADFTYLNETIEIPNVTGNLEIEISTLETIASKKTSELTYFDSEKILVDSNRNIVKVPEGFKIAEDSGINVTEGIVIEDNDIVEGIGNNRGNQYVWIPVGENIRKADGTTVDIELGRYIFADGINHKDEDGNTLIKGKPILKQSAENYANETEINIKEIIPTTSSNYVHKELKTNRAGVESSGTDGLNATALNLKGFIDSVKGNAGYYIARYEASYGVDGKPNSKVSNNFHTDSTAPTTEGYLWNNIRQINAATASRGLYETVNSDLMNSYAWDTAIVYIQEFSGDTDYSHQTSKNIGSNPENTGVNGDEVCKINDMASNTLEWTTEYCTGTTNSGSNPCTSRGGTYIKSDFYTSIHVGSYATTRDPRFTFRPTLYM